MHVAPIQSTGLERAFGRRPALLGVDLRVGAGEIVGLVGPNGSGKTTLLRILAGFLWPDAGEARVFGLEPRRHRARIMERARFVFAPPALFPTLTAREHVVHLSALRTTSMPSIRSRDAADALDTVGLADRADDRVATFSFGMRQRLAVAQALVPRPRLLVLDEPTDGLDPLAVLELRGVLRRLRDEHGVAILLSSHLTVEIDRLVDRVLVLSEGRTLYCGAPAGLIEGRECLRLVSADPVAARAALAEAGLAAVPSDDGAVELPAGSITLERARGLLAARGVELRAFVPTRPTLEEALLARLRQARAGEEQG